MSNFYGSPQKSRGFEFPPLDEEIARMKNERGLLGQIGMAAHPFLANPQPVIQAHQNEREGEVVTLTAFANNLLDNQSALPFGTLVYLALQIGNGKFSLPTINVAVGNGIHMALPGCSWTVQAFSNTPTPITVGAFLTRGWKARHSRSNGILAPVAVQSLAANATATFNVPAFATYFKLVGGTTSLTPGGPWLISVLAAGNQQISSFVLNPSDDCPEIQLTQNAATIQVTNQGQSSYIEPMIALDFA